jgi:hypothetical protein
MARDGSNPVEAQNLRIVDAHMRGEADDPASVMSLYADDIVFDVPGRNICLTDRTSIEANYRQMFASIAELELEPIRRDARGDFVEDWTLARFRLVGDGFANCPVPVGSHVALRLHHVFKLRDGTIVRETVHEDGRCLAGTAQPGGNAINGRKRHEEETDRLGLRGRDHACDTGFGYAIRVRTERKPLIVGPVRPGGADPYDPARDKLHLSCRVR